MTSFTTASFIALKIWLAALCLHTAIGSLLLSNDGTDFLLIAIIGGIIGGFFSAPIFILLWAVLHYFLKKGRPATFIFKIVFTLGVGAAFLAVALFLHLGGMGSTQANAIAFFFLPPACGAVAIIINYQGIQAACLRRDEADLLLHHFDTPTEPSNAQL